MNLAPSTPKKSLNKAFRLLKPKRRDMELFKSSLLKMLGHIDEKESEENVKFHLMQFLKEAHFKEEFHIATKGRTDFVIHTGKTAASPSAVLFEVKRPTNKGDMVSLKSLNAKAMHEIILYFLKERILLKNNSMTQIIITNIYEWFIFDAGVFERIFAKNKGLVTAFQKWHDGQLITGNTDLFYNEIARPFLDLVTEEIPFTHFDIRDFKKYIENDNPDDDNALIPLFKIFSPVHLLKLPFTNDSNSLDKGFYSELLHLIGLEEVKDGSRKIIKRKAKPDFGSLIENTITILDTEVQLSRVPSIENYGETRAQQLEAIALELNITWINRILFLKLLEAQLIKYHRGDRQYSFLNFTKIPEYDALNKLFFQVLARREDERRGAIAEDFKNIPYLNSSLFEPTQLESVTFRISGLDDALTLPLFKNSVLKKSQKDSSPVTSHESPITLNYLLSFLDAYDFASEGSEDIQEESKTLINAAVLGLIFEKINGYKDGSIFTPGFITMYMCRESIRAAVVQKFTEKWGWKCDSFDDVKNYLADKRRTEDVLEANVLLNSLRICDPAVGSGHFLVSALNEIIAIKSELGLLADDKGVRISGYAIDIEGDELIVTDEATGNFFQYEVQNGQIAREAQRLQKTLFHEKQRIIENCLFGVDINPNSVKICRLRLWIELLKNAYYTEDSGFKNLETLPNIDINIKCGNSLVSRFPLDADLNKSLAKFRYSFKDYRALVHRYVHARDKDTKHELEGTIAAIRGQYGQELSSLDVRKVRLSAIKGQLTALDSEIGFVEPTPKQAHDIAKRREKLEAELQKAAGEILEVERADGIYRNAFEWRFEFPEVLDDAGSYKGFDVVVGNPPYIRQEEFSDLKNFLKSYKVFAGTADLLVYFIERGMSVLKEGGQFNFIIANKFMRAGFGKSLRAWLQNYRLLKIIDFGDLPVFDEATTYPLILSMQKSKPQGETLALNVENLQFDDFKKYADEKSFTIAQKTLSDDGWNLSKGDSHALIEKIKKGGKPLGEYVNGQIYRGVLTGLNEAFVIDKAKRDELILKDPKSAELLKPFLAGRDVKRYGVPQTDKFLILMPKGWTNSFKNEGDSWEFLKTNFPAIAEHLEPFKEAALKRTDKGDYWWELRSCDYYSEFEKPKIVLPDISLKSNFAFENVGSILGNTAYMIPVYDAYLLAILNSNLLQYFYASISPSIRGGYLRFINQYLVQLPIKEIPAAEQEPFKKLVEEILAKKQKGEETSELERRIDELVYVLYDLSAEEIAVVEGGK